MSKLSSEEVQRLIDEALEHASKRKRKPAAGNGKAKATDPSKPEKPAWLNKSIKGKAQGPLSILANVMAALRHDPSPREGVCLRRNAAHHDAHAKGRAANRASAGGGRRRLSAPRISPACGPEKPRHRDCAQCRGAARPRMQISSRAGLSRNPEMGRHTSR